MQVPASGEGVLARIHLIYVGPLDEQHQVRTLAQAFLAARDHDPRLHLLMAGAGDERDWFERHLSRAATFLGTLAGPELSELGCRCSPSTAARPRA